MSTTENWKDIFRMQVDNSIARQHPTQFKNKIVKTDCMRHMDTLPDNLFDIIVTDPPFLFAKHVNGANARCDYSDADTLIVRRYFDDFFSKAFRVLKKNNGNLYCFCDVNSFPIFHDAMKKHTPKIRNLVWDKKYIKLGYTWRHQHELILFASTFESKGIPSHDGDVLRYSTVDKDNKLHNAQKPLPLLEKLIGKHGSGNLIFDPFGGSGSTAVAACNTQNYFYVNEMDSNYYAIMKKNILQNTNTTDIEVQL